MELGVGVEGGRRVIGSGGWKGEGRGGRRRRGKGGVGKGRVV